MPKDDIERSFPGLSVGSYRITSPVNPDYNCAAWAAAETHRWWDPSPEDGYYWPLQASQEQSLDEIVAAFAVLGYESSADARPEPGVEKLAIYADSRRSPTHIARQLPSGTWTSKLGASEDIEHGTLESLEGAIYGKVVHYLRRKSGLT
jgi:hypothetical protein